MKIALLSDWHIGQTKDKTIQKAFAEIATYEPDLIVNAGDNNGGWYGAKAVHTIHMRLREAMPDTPVVACLGNHDFWVRGRKHGNDFFNYSSNTPGYRRPAPDVWLRNYQDILDTFKKFNIHFLDLDGPYRDPEHAGIAVFGHTMWYENSAPPSNDAYFMPVGYEGDTHAYLRSTAYKQVYESIDKLTENDKTIIFVSHFPVIKTDNDYDFHIWSGSESFGHYLQDDVGVQYFLNGHAHQLHKGPVRWEAGSDYGFPKFIIIDVPDAK